MSGHIHESELLRYIEGHPRRRQGIERHLAACDECRELMTRPDVVIDQSMLEPEISAGMARSVKELIVRDEVEQSGNSLVLITAVVAAGACMLGSFLATRQDENLIALGYGLLVVSAILASAAVALRVVQGNR